MHIYTHSYINACIHTYIHTGRQTDRPTDGPTNKQRYLHTNMEIHMYIHTYIKICVYIYTYLHVLISVCDTNLAQVSGSPTRRRSASHRCHRRLWPWKPAGTCLRPYQESSALQRPQWLATSWPYLPKIAMVSHTSNISQDDAGKDHGLYHIRSIVGSCCPAAGRKL